MDGAHHRTAAPARFARRRLRRALPGLRDATSASPGTHCRVAAARLARQRTPRTAAGPRVPSELIAATMIQHAYIFYRTSG